ncbi:MAG: Gfo/Idh/MocA family oxidoreductase [Candidatus Hydrogenedentes bacterium]|nr:Gfo/Idh/MocA family oxidoreductase [Candidatus Hydrogenedentota bacterium]
MGRVTRRGFLCNAAAGLGTAAGIGATGVAAAAGRGRASTSDGPSDRVNVGVIGCRNRGSAVAKAMLESGEFSVAMLCDCDSFGRMAGQSTVRKFAYERHPEPEVVADFRQVLDSAAVDAVVVATPDHWHALLCSLALDAGKHVYLEKPASYNIEDGKAMVAAQGRHPDLTVLVGTQQRSGRHFEEAREFVRAGGLGTVGFCRASQVNVCDEVPVVADADPPPGLDYEMWVGPGPMRPYNARRVHYNWRYMRDYGTGDLGNWGAHWLDIVLWYLDLGYPTAVSAAGGQFVVHDAKEWPDTQTVLCEYPGLTVLWEQRLWARGAGTAPCELHGEKGTLQISRGKWVFRPREGEPEEHEGSEMDEAHVRHFAACVRGDARPVAGIEDGHKTAVLCHLGNISTVVGRKVAFDGENQTIVGDAEAQALEGRAYREPWQISPA